MEYHTELIELIRPIVGYTIKNAKRDYSECVMDIEKNGENFKLSMDYIGSLKGFCKATVKQHGWGVLNPPTDEPILSNMTERKAYWLLTDNNLNYIQSFKTYDDYKRSFNIYEYYFYKDKEQWGLGELVRGTGDYAVIKLYHKGLFKPEWVREFSFEKEGEFDQKVYLHNTKSFAYIRKSEGGMKNPNEMLYVFYRSGDELRSKGCINQWCIYYD